MVLGSRKRARLVAPAATILATLLVPERAHAEVAVSVRYESESERELARRLGSELSSAGYVVDVVKASEPLPCDAEGTRLEPVDRPATVWIRLSSEGGNETLVASICYLGTLPFLQRASVTAPSGEPQKLALATAEAVNGLRSKLPPFAVNPDQGVPKRAAAAEAPHSPPEAPRREPLVNSALLGTAVLLNLPDVPATPGVVGRATLGIGPALGLALDAFVPTTGRELTSTELTATVRTTWLRVGPRLSGAAGDFELSGAALAGPAFTWATGESNAPSRVGTTDVTTGAVLSLAAFVEYPRRGPVFACVALSASALLPGVRVDLGGDAPKPSGSWPLDASVGFGLRWGEER